jgi:FAD/FMN-containing dehydrogenase
MELVLANGSIVTASPTSQVDLYWGMRGAGWNFAIVTEFHMITHPAPQATQYNYNITIGNASALAKAFSTWQKFVSQPNLTRLFASTVTVTQDIVIISGTYYGSKEEFGTLGLDAVFGSANLGLKVVSSIATGLFTEIQNVGLDIVGPISAHFYCKSLKYTNRTLMSDEAIMSMAEYLYNTDKGTPLWFAIWDLEAGAIADTPQDGTAYWHRDAIFFLQTIAINLLGQTSQKTHDFITGLNKNIQQNTPGIDDSAYPGYTDSELQNPLVDYWGGNVPRLERVKAEVDPDNVFRNPQSVPVGGG